MKTLSSLFDNHRFWCHLSTLVVTYCFEYPSSFESPRNLLILLLCYLVTEFIYETLGYKKVIARLNRWADGDTKK